MEIINHFFLSKSLVLILRNEVNKLMKLFPKDRTIIKNNRSYLVSVHKVDIN